MTTLLASVLAPPSGLASSCYSDGKFRDINGGIWEEGFGKTNHDFHRGLFSGRTGWASHFLGPPSLFSLPSSFVKRKWNEPPTSLWKGGGADAVGPRSE